MASREQQNYEDTKNFLYSHRSYKIANLGYTCLELKDPWSVDMTLNRGRDSQYQRAAILAQDAATKAHFYLMAVNAPTHHLVYGQMRFLVICDVRELEMTLQRVDFPIDQNALDLFSPVIRTGQNIMP
ncbi:hypothetical protein C8R41DRAFT_869325 [Lentinula lateritia]|uniref:Uncharacterized protein n=1 Tax=Lentinula lateritia TaxID=40482 RepID=A0ABQ8V7R1_9AGAR|nr:hypothetical protein C8R41DRAFT_869325 [Lentinula lateritia]